MPLTVTLDLPSDVEERLRRQLPELELTVKTAYALEIFRQGEISHFELSRLLGLDRFETDALLKDRRIYEGSPTMADLEADGHTIDLVFSERG